MKYKHLLYNKKNMDTNFNTGVLADFMTSNNMVSSAYSDK